MVPLDASVSFTCDGVSFLGAAGSTVSPAALREVEQLNGKADPGCVPCAAVQVTLGIAPRDSVELAFLLGETIGEPAARELVEK